MKLYAIRDRLVDYWGQPFAGPDDRAVMQAVARTVNSGEATSDIAQAPHQFEIHQLGHVTEDGHIVPDRRFVCDCSSLIRRGVRSNEAPDRAEPEAGPAAGARGGDPAGSRIATETDPRPVQSAPYGASEAVAEVHRGTAGGYPPRGE